MTVTQYESRFVDLACHALLLLRIEEKRVRRFIEGLTHPIRLQMAKETGSEISFQAAANVTRKIEMILAQERGHRSDKRPHQFGGFSGASAGGRGNFGRGYPPRPFHSALHESPDASGSHSPIMPYSGQSALSAHSSPISAPPLQSHYSNSSGPFRSRQDSRAIIPTLVASPPAQPTRSRGHAARGGGQAIRGGGQTVRGGSQPPRGHPRDAV
ncbi:uncharacterized protein [Nicotiana tomentosiformis]|uniref:uncharacterized protein n=1 Tax=Nicotiana tomentosiformis TaxID=4098 RepID=UPI00388C7EDD